MKSTARGKKRKFDKKKEGEKDWRKSTARCIRSNNKSNKAAKFVAHLTTGHSCHSIRLKKTTVTVSSRPGSRSLLFEVRPVFGRFDGFSVVLETSYDNSH